MSTQQRAILVGAVVTGVLSSSYLGLINILCCLGVLIGGAVTAQQLASGTDGPIETGDGALLGAGAGALGAVIAGLIEFALRPLGLDSQTIQQDFMKGFMEGVQQGGGQMPPGFEQMMQGEVGTMMILVGIGINMILYAVFGAIGGAIGTAIFGRSDNSGAAEEASQV